MTCAQLPQPRGGTRTFARCFAPVFTSSTHSRWPWSLPLRPILRDGTDRQIGGHEGRPFGHPSQRRFP